MRRWIITAGGDSVELYGAYEDFILGRPGLFSLTLDDVAFVRRTMLDDPEGAIYALLSSVLRAGTAYRMTASLDGKLVPVWALSGMKMAHVLFKPGDRLEDKDSPAIVLELTDLGNLLVFFERESYPFWKRLMGWLSGNAAVASRARVILKEWCSQRTWETTPEAIVRSGFQFSSDPTKRARCPAGDCGAELSFEELLATKRCNKCGRMLA